MPKKKTVPKSKVEMLSYAIKMVIPTVAYGNIQPEIIVKAPSADEAHDFIVPHMNKLWKEYYLVDGKRPETHEPAPVVVAPVAPVVVTPVVPVVVAPIPPAVVTPEPPAVVTPEPPVTPTFVSPVIAVNTTTPPAPVVAPPVAPVAPPVAPVAPVAPPPSSVAFVKANQAIHSCMSAAALQLIIDQVYISVKLTDADKIALSPLLDEKYKELNPK